MDVIYIAVSAMEKWKWNCLCGQGEKGGCEQGGQTVKSAWENALNSVSCNWDNAWVNYGDEPEPSLEWDAAVVDMADSPPVLSTASPPAAAAAAATACWNFYEDAKRVEFGAMPTPPFEFLSLLLFGATLSATNYLRQLSADWSYLRTALSRAPSLPSLFFCQP